MTLQIRNRANQPKDFHSSACTLLLILDQFYDNLCLPCVAMIILLAHVETNSDY